MVGEQGLADERDAVVGEAQRRLVERGEVDLAGGDPEPVAHVLAGFEVRTQLIEGGLAFADDGRDLVVLGAVGLEADCYGSDYLRDLVPV